MNEKKRRPRVASASRLVGRVIGYMLHYYKYLFLLVIACILINAVATVVGATFPQKLVDNYIMPMLNTGSDDFSSLARDLFQLAGIMAIGVVAAFTYNRIMVNVSQGTMLHLRDDLFARMEALPIKYFDTHAHGDIMSVYTNDVDTLRQLLSQSIPQIINSLISMTATLVTMLILNPALTVISILTAVVMLLVTSNFSKLSGKYFIRQQIDLGAVDGFIEEMMDGQKVVKVFCHEEKAMEDFHKVNEKLRDSANKANRYANLLMPINANIGWISYALVAIVGAILGINGLAGVTIGTVVTFVGLNKSFTNPITQVSQQINFVVNAAAGAQRVFDLMDQEPEVDECYVELVNATEDENGNLLESSVIVSVMTCAAPMVRRGLEGMSDEEYRAMVYKRIDGMLKTAAYLGYKVLILGAFGCGAFGNDARIDNRIKHFRRFICRDGQYRTAIPLAGHLTVRNIRSNAYAFFIRKEIMIPSHFHTMPRTRIFIIKRFHVPPINVRHLIAAHCILNLIVRIRQIDSRIPHNQRIIRINDFRILNARTYIIASHRVGRPPIFRCGKTRNRRQGQKKR